MPQSKIVRVGRKKAFCQKCKAESLSIQLWLKVEDQSGFITMEFCWGCVSKMVDKEFRKL